MNSVEQRGFASAVITANANYSFCEIERSFAVIFKLDKRYGMKIEHELKIRREGANSKKTIERSATRLLLPR